MRYKFFVNSLKTWEAMFEAIKNAQRSVYLEMYILEENTPPFDFLNLLQTKARNGLRVIIILDSYGSADLDKSSVVALRESGAEVLFHSSFLHRAHRKILIVDENVAFVGGVNLSPRFKLWNDLAVEVRSIRLVRHIINSFAKAYTACGGKNSFILAQNKKIILNKMRSWLVEHFPLRKNLTLKKIYKEHLGKAKENIILVTPYFMPRRWLIGLLHQAVLRGVKVEVLVPKTTDHFIVDRVDYFFMFKLSKLGVNFLLEPQMNHAKAMIVDGREGMVGSNNLDFISFELNSEVGIFFKDVGAVRRLLEIVNVWKKDAVLFDFKAFKPTLFDRFLSPVIRIFFRII